MARPITTPGEALVATVTTHPGSTAAEVAAVLGIGRSSAQKRLAALEATAAVRRDPGGRVHGVRAPDHWHPAGAGAGAGAVAGALPASVLARGGGAAFDPAPAEDEPVPAEGPRRSARLRRGALAAMVRDHLAERPTASFGPAALGQTLGRSPGAISNALAGMVERGEAVLVADKPRRYRIAR